MVKAISTFDRSTGATRINKDGLIEEVGYFSSELVQNGDFSELGSELVVQMVILQQIVIANWSLQPIGLSSNGKATLPVRQALTLILNQSISITCIKTKHIKLYMN